MMPDEELLKQVNWDVGTQNGPYDKVNRQLKILFEPHDCASKVHHSKDPGL